MIGSMTKKPLFTCTEYCRFDDCQVQVNVKVESESSLKAVVCFQEGIVRQVLTTGVLKTLSWGEREKQRRHENEMVSLQLMSEDVQDKDDQWIQKNDLGPTPFDYHFKDVIQQASLDKVGEPNEYFCPNFIPKLLKYFLPQAALWSRLLLGDLGRHGRGPFYEKLSKRFKTVAQKSTQVMKKILNPSLSTSNLKEAQEKHRDSFPQHTTSQLKSPYQSTSAITDAHEQKPSPEHVTSQVNFLNKAL
ncbi:hypothetical protein KUCAC02_018383 [Chaenocephalus aceratus]|uniref:Uncharacterized protein n=1 Tax=Chaenocephalus aceratus TaxID=36190 RepID=A0ACB9W9U7_CHAAC|nr:hypothetical protein KUCAC02_018383 [Chaenocephalus aceratus]